MATVSMTNATTPKLTNRYGCYTDGTDILCDANAPYVSSGGLIGVGIIPSVPLEVSGTISATNFVGNGSGLTGVVAASGDRIVSGSTSLLAVSDTGYVSLTQSGVNTGWFNPQTGFVTIGVSSTGAISGTRGYFGSMGIGTASPATSLTVVGEVQVSDSGVACSAATAGAIRYTAGSLLYCNGATFTSLSSNTTANAVVAGSTNDVQYNSSGSLAADSGNFTYASGCSDGPDPQRHDT